MAARKLEVQLGYPERLDGCADEAAFAPTRWDPDHVR